MKLASLIPTPAQITREAVILVCGALLAAVIVRQLLPAEAKNYVRDAWV